MSGIHDPLPKAIRRAAGDQNLTRSDIARFMGLSHTTVGDWFNGERTPSRAQLIELEALLEVESGQLCVLAGYLPEGDDPKVERTADAVIVRLSAVVRNSTLCQPDLAWGSRPMDLQVHKSRLKAA